MVIVLEPHTHEVWSLVNPKHRSHRWVITANLVALWDWKQQSSATECGPYLSRHLNLSLLNPLGSDAPSKQIWLLQVHKSNFGQQPFLPPPMTHTGTSGSWTQGRWVQVHHLNHGTTAALTWIYIWTNYLVKQTHHLLNTIPFNQCVRISSMDGIVTTISHHKLTTDRHTHQHTLHSSAHMFPLICLQSAQEQRWHKWKKIW